MLARRAVTTLPVVAYLRWLDCPFWLALLCRYRYQDYGL